MTDERYQVQNFLRRLEKTAQELLIGGDDELADMAIAAYRAFRDHMKQGEQSA